MAEGGEVLRVQEETVEFQGREGLGLAEEGREERGGFEQVGDLTVGFDYVHDVIVKFECFQCIPMHLKIF